MRKGQITVFILLGAIMLILFLIAVYLMNNRTNLEYNFDTSTIQGYVRACLYQTSEKGLVLLGKQGGSLEPTDYVITTSYRVNKYMDASDVPSRDAMDAELAAYIDRKLDDCIKDFRGFREQGWEIATTAPRSSVRINQQSVSVGLDYQVTAKKNERTISESQYLIEHDIKLWQLTEDARLITAGYAGLANLTQLDSLDYKTNVFSLGGGLLIDMEDDSSYTREGGYHFMFGLNLEK